MIDPKCETLLLNHDLRNYIGAAISHLQLLMLDYPSLEKNQNVVAAIESLYQSINLTTNLYKLVKLYSGTEKINIKFKTYIMQRAFL